MGKAESNKRMFTKEEIAEAMKSIVLSRKRIHVIAYGDGWGVLRESNKRLNKIHRDKQSAVDHARRLALNEKDIDALVIVHKEDGSLDRYIHADN